MSSTASTIHRGHPITVAAAEINALLDELVDQSTWSMKPEETRATLPELTRLKARVAELELRVTAHADRNRVGDDSGATSTAVWLANQTKQTRREAHHDLELAKALDTDRHQPVRATLAAGEVLVDLAAVIVRAVDALSDDLPPDIPGKAEQMLLEYAADHDATRLRILGKRALDVIDPDAADAHEAKILEREEDQARAAASFTMTDDGHGKTHGRFTIPTLHGAMLKKALMAIAAPNTGLPWTARHPCRVGRRTSGWARRSWSRRALPRGPAAQGRRPERHHPGHHHPGEPS
jgi:hypothetical protein